ncbi:Ig-like domain-containing protein [Roseibacillus persicicus]
MISPFRSFPFVVLLISSVGASAEEMILAGWHDFSGSYGAFRNQGSAKKADASYFKVSGSLWGGDGARVSAQGCNDGTFGESFPVGSAAIDGAMSVRTDSAGISFTVTNNSVRAIGLQRILFDFASINGNSPQNLTLTYQQGDLSNANGTVIWSRSAVHNGISASADYEDVEIDLTALTDRCLGVGETARFLLEGDTASNPTQALFLDNVAVTGTVDEIAVLTYNIHGGYGPNGQGTPADNLGDFYEDFMQGEDVLCLQEVGEGSSASDEYQAAKDVFSADYPYSYQTIYEATDRAWYQSALESSLVIFSRYPFVDTHSQLIQIDPQGDEWSRFAQHVVIEVGGEQINIFNFHNTYNFGDDDYASEKAGMSKFKDYVFDRLDITQWSEAEDDNVVMLGDFNLRNGAAYLDVTEVLDPPVLTSNGLDHVASVESKSNSGFYAAVAAGLSDHPGIWVTYDFASPSAEPLEWVSPPQESAVCEVSMEAEWVADSGGVQYYFSNKTVADGSHDSGWQVSPSYTDTGLDPATTYEYTVKVRDLSANQNESVESAATAATTAALVAESLPYAESFEAALGAWKQSSDDDWDWTWHSGGTDTGATGPIGASDGVQYLYVENHGTGAQYKTSSLEALFDFTGAAAPTLFFDYHMYGVYIDFLAVDVHDGTSWTNDVWIRNNQQHSSSEEAWSTAEVDLSTYAGLAEVTLRFRSKQKQWHAADTAIDNLILEDTNTAPEAIGGSAVVRGETAVLLAASDADDDGLNYTIITPPSHGSLSGTAPELLYTPDAGYVGPDSFIFKVDDGNVDSGEVTVALFVGNVLVGYGHSAGATSPDYEYGSVSSVVTLGGGLAGGEIATTIDQLSVAEGTGLPSEVAEDDYGYFLSYIVEPNGSSIGYESLFVDAFAKEASRSYQLSYRIEGGEEVFLTSGAVSAGGLEDEGNFEIYDFPDFVTDASVEFRIYWQGGPASSSESRVYLDDFFLTGEVFSDLEMWRSSYFQTVVGEGVAADDGNPDGDSLDNYAEFILGTDPGKADSPLVILSTGDEEITVSYSRRKVDGVNVYAEWSRDLKDPWFTDGLSEELAGDDGVFETMAVSLPVSAAEARKFLSIVVERPE